MNRDTAVRIIHTTCVKIRADPTQDAVWDTITNGLSIEEIRGITMPDRRNRLSFPAQILTTAIIVAVLVLAAHLSSSEEDSKAFDRAAEKTRLQIEGAARGVKVDAPVDDKTQVPVEHEEL